MVPNPIPWRVSRADIGVAAELELELGAALGDGASGDVFAATYREREVAVKVFKAEVSPDGRAADEISVACHVKHDHLVEVLALVEHPYALIVNKVGMHPEVHDPDLSAVNRVQGSRP